MNLIHLIHRQQPNRLKSVAGPNVRIVAAFQNVRAKVLTMSIDQPIKADVLVCLTTLMLRSKSSNWSMLPECGDIMQGYLPMQMLLKD